MSASDWYIVVNPHAGSGKTMHEWGIAQQELEARGINYISVFTQKIGHAKELAHKAALEGYRRFIAVGGDGSIHEVFSGIHSAIKEASLNSSEFTFSVIPIGSGNDWIKGVGIPHNTIKAIDAFASGSTTVQDLIEVQTSDGQCCTMANVGGTGFDSHVCDRVNAQKARGMRSKRIFINALLYTIAHMKSINISVLCDGVEVFNGACYSISIGNGRYSGGGMLQTPIADNADGQLDMLLVPVIPIAAIAHEMPKLFKGNIHESEYTKYFRAKEIQIIPLDAESSDLLEVDGDIEGKLPVRISATGMQINIPAPANTNQK